MPCPRTQHNAPFAFGFGVERTNHMRPMGWNHFGTIIQLTAIDIPQSKFLTHLDINSSTLLHDIPSNPLQVIFGGCTDVYLQSCYMKLRIFSSACWHCKQCKVCLITISDTASVEARKTLTRNIGRSQQD